MCARYVGIVRPPLRPTWWAGVLPTVVLPVVVALIERQVVGPVVLGVGYMLFEAWIQEEPLDSEDGVSM